MVHSIHHLNFIVRDLDAAIPAWERLLGLTVARRDELPERGAIAGRLGELVGSRVGAEVALLWDYESA